MSDLVEEYDNCEEEDFNSNEEIDSDDDEPNDPQHFVTEFGRSRNISTQPAYELLDLDRLSDLMSQIIGDVIQIINLPLTYVRLGLSQFKWNKQRLVEYFFEHGVESLLRILDVPQVSSDPNFEFFTNISNCCCAICCEAAPSHEFIQIQCKHKACTKCWYKYLKTTIMESVSTDRIHCMSHGCRFLMFDELAQKIFERISDNECKLRLRKLLAQSFVMCNSEITWCPAPSCTFAARLNTTLVSLFNERYITAISLASKAFSNPISNRLQNCKLSDSTYMSKLFYKINCSCNEEFCHGCGQLWHEPVICEILNAWLIKSRDDSETSNWIAANTKDCPKCHATIEKAGGCNHMVCRYLACRYEFCWVCLGEWEPHGAAYNNCNRYSEEVTKKARNAQEQSRSALQRYLFYFNRYANHLNSLSLEKKLYNDINSKMYDMQSLGMSWIEVQFLKAAVDKLRMARRTLMYTYVFAYYLIKNNQVEIFEDNQHDLEMATEKLSKYLERDITQDILTNIKQQVQDKARYCEARHQALLDHVYEGYEKDMWKHTSHNSLSILPPETFFKN